jgi:hypothetical protein
MIADSEYSQAVWLSDYSLSVYAVRGQNEFTARNLSSAVTTESRGNHSRLPHGQRRGYVAFNK